MYSMLEWQFGGVLSPEHTPAGHTETHKRSFSHINKYVGEMVIMDDLECHILSHYVIYFEQFRKVIQLREKEALSILVQS